MGFVFDNKNQVITACENGFLPCCYTRFAKHLRKTDLLQTERRRASLENRGTSNESDQLEGC